MSDGVSVDVPAEVEKTRRSFWHQIRKEVETRKVTAEQEPRPGTRVHVGGRTWVYTYNSAVHLPHSPAWTWRCETTHHEALYDHHVALNRIAELEAKVNDPR